MQLKTCAKCNQTKELTDFYNHKRGKFGVDYKCKSCVKQYNQDNAEHRAEYMKQYNQDNAEQIKQWRDDNAEKIAARTKQHYQDNAEHIAENQKQYYQKNKEHIAARNKPHRADNAEYYKQWRIDNTELMAEYGKQYRQTPKGKASDKANQHNRRAYKLQNGGKHTGAQVLTLFNLQSGKCPYCKIKLHKTGNNKYHIDHFMPLSKGGSNDISNIQLLCPTCNLTKSAKLPEEFAAEHGKLF